MSEPLFEIIDSLPEDEPRAKRGTKKAQKYDVDNRTVVGWFRLPHTQGFCTVPLHDEIQELMTDERKEYRQKYPTRMLHPINGYMVCRDCFLVTADVQAAERNLDPLVFEDTDA